MSESTPERSTPQVSLLIKNPSNTSEEYFELAVPLEWNVLDLKRKLALDYAGNPEVFLQRVRSRHEKTGASLAPRPGLSYSPVLVKTPRASLLLFGSYENRSMTDVGQT
jgi:hypothetical protein